jgi:hypothetical protein
LRSGIDRWIIFYQIHLGLAAWSGLVDGESTSAGGEFTFEKSETTIDSSDSTSVVYSGDK